MNLDFDTSNQPNPFTVPEGFFQENRNAVMGRVARHRRVMFIRRSAAAAIAAVAMIAWNQLNPAETLSPDQNLDLLISQASDAQLSDAVALADAESLFDTEFLGDY